MISSLHLSNFPISINPKLILKAGPRINKGREFLVINSQEPSKQQQHHKNPEASSLKLLFFNFKSDSQISCF